MKSIIITTAIAMLVSAGIATAGGGKKHDTTPQQNRYEYAPVLDVQPIFREVSVSNPIRECWNEPVYQTRRQHNSAGGMLAGGLLGGIIGHQVGKGRGNRIATAVGTLVGAKIGHDVMNAGVINERKLAGYDEHCSTRHQVSYEQVVDGYDVTYEYRGREYRLVMPYDPGRHIKMRIEFTPVF